MNGSHSSIPPILPAAAPPPRRRGWLHLGLLGATLLTLAFAGGTTWSPPDSGSAAAIFWAGIPYALCVLAILGAHEMGHYLACVHYRIPATLPFFIPGIPVFLGSFGAVIRIRGPIPDRRALFDVAAAGPIAGFVVAVPALVLGFLRAEPDPAPPTDGMVSLGTPLLWSLLEWVRPQGGPVRVNYLIGAGWVGMLVTSLNLFPVGQLDGGHAAYALSPRLHRLLARSTLIVLGAWILFDVAINRQIPPYLLWFAILVWMRDRHPRLVDERIGLGAGRRLVWLLLLAIFLLAFIPTPFTMQS